LLDEILICERHVGTSFGQMLMCEEDIVATCFCQIFNAIEKVISISYADFYLLFLTKRQISCHIRIFIEERMIGNIHLLTYLQ
jgi:hypothetical protein